MRSGSTMKVSLTPDRLKTFEVIATLLVIHIYFTSHPQFLGLQQREELTREQSPSVVRDLRNPLRSSREGHL